MSTAVRFQYLAWEAQPTARGASSSLTGRLSEALADFIAWLVLFCFRLANEVKPETNSVVLTFYANCSRTPWLTRAGLDFFEDAHTQNRLAESDRPDGMSEEERSTVEHLTFLRPTVATLASSPGLEN